MDNLRGIFGDRGSESEDLSAFETEEEVRHEPPPSIGQDERRMQVRAYNHWASLLHNRNFPSIEDLDPEALPDFGPYSVLLDFSGGIENPSIQYLGGKLAEECGAEGQIGTLADVPSRSLLSRITDHYMQILANQAPIGFEAEFVNQREATILYRGILLPFSSDDDTIDFIYGVINWKELADQQTTDELMHGIDQALETAPEVHREIIPEAPMDEWVDEDADVLDLKTEAEVLEPGAGAEVLELGSLEEVPAADVLDLASMEEVPTAGLDWPEPEFGRDEVSEESELPVDVIDIADAEDLSLGDWLASARELAQAAKGSEDRTRTALYAAIGRAYDFSLAANAAPEDFAELLADSGLSAQDRAPLTPLVKLVFGIDYDKTRLAEFASALGHAQRLGLTRGGLGDYLATVPGGLKGVVAEERKLRRAESGKSVETREGPREALARKLRKREIQNFETLSAEGSEFALLMIRRLPSGELALLGEVPQDGALIERAARKLLG